MMSDESAYVESFPASHRSIAKENYRDAVAANKTALAWMAGLQTVTLVFAGFLYAEKSKNEK